jgi:hypothetical protein
MEVPRRSVQLIDVGEGATVISLVCEGLAQIDDVADVVRSVGPTIVVTPLVDGPQLSSRWASRYASVLADDPGSAVLTLTSFGMAQRSRPPGAELLTRGRVVARSQPGHTRDPTRDRRARNPPISKHRSCQQTKRRRTPTRRQRQRTLQHQHPPDPGLGRRSGPMDSWSGPTSPPKLELDELTILASWAEAVADALALAPERLHLLHVQARARAPWRMDLGIPQPSPQLDQAIADLFHAAQEAARSGDSAPPDTLTLPTPHSHPSEPSLDRLVRRLLRSAQEQRQNRLAHDSDRLGSLPDRRRP